LTTCFVRRLRAGFCKSEIGNPQSEN